MINNFMLWNLPITDDIEAKRSVFGRFITWNYKNTSIKRILMRLNRLYCHNTCWMLIAVTIWNVQSIAMTSHNVLVCSNSSTQWLTSNLLIWIQKLKLFIHGWSITSCFETCQLRTILKLNVPFLVDFITWNYKNTSIKRIFKRLNHLHCHNTC